MPSDLHKIEKYFEGKKIALFGNAKSVMEMPFITEEDYDIIIRINKGTPVGFEEFMGERTDILGLSLNISKDEIDCFFGSPKFIFYCSPKNRENLNNYLKQTAIFYPQNSWDILESSIGARPSTGLMIIDFIWNNAYFKKLDLYGFDFMKTPTKYTGTLHTGEHNYKREEMYIKRIISKSNGRMAIND